MRLTNQLREEFVRNVMNDVPHVDYDEQIRKFVTTMAVESLPAPVKRVWDDINLRTYVNLCHFSSEHTYVSIDIPSKERWTDAFKLSPSEEDVLKELEAKRYDQNATRKKLRQELETAVKGVTTTKALRKMFPEFEAYIPEDKEADRMLPATNNLVTDLVRAGWPKGGKPTPV